MQGRRTMKDHNEMYHMDYKDTKKQAYKDKSDGSVTSRRGLLTGRSGHGSRISRCFAGGLIRRIRTSAEQSSSQPTVRRPSTVRDCSSRGLWKHNIHAPVRKRAGHFDGARFSPHKSDVAIPRAEACRKSHVICVDLRAYGRSGIPTSTNDHFPYSKRAMPNELVE